jgi:Ca2+-binding RTX toxin-like protein
MPGLTQADVLQLRAMMGSSYATSNNRGGFYLRYYELIKGYDQQAAAQVLLQAHISTYSGFFGGAALLGNAIAKFARPDLYTITLDQFSWDIANALLLSIEASVANSGTGIFSATQIQAFDQGVWQSKGLGDYFPGNFQLWQQDIDNLITSSSFSDALAGYQLLFGAKVGFVASDYAGVIDSTNTDYDIVRDASGNVVFVREKINLFSQITARFATDQNLELFAGALVKAVQDPENQPFINSLVAGVKSFNEALAAVVGDILANQMSKLKSGPEFDYGLRSKLIGFLGANGAELDPDGVLPNGLSWNDFPIILRNEGTFADSDAAHVLGAYNTATVDGGGGGDLLLGFGGATIEGGSGDDLLFARGNDFDGTVTAYGDSGNDILIGVKSSSVDGGTGDDLVIVNGRAEAKGGDGKDVILSIRSTGRIDGDGGKDLIFVAPVAAYGSDPAQTISGGADNDVIITLGGAGAYSYGGTGGDILIGWSGEDHLYGGTGSGADGEEDWFIVSHNTFIHDAGSEDYVYWGPLRVNGGVQQWWMEGNWAAWMPLTSLVSGAPLPFLMAFGALAPLMMLAVQFDILCSLLFQFYRTTSGQLVIQTALGLAGQAVIENYELDLESGKASGHVVVFKQQIVFGTGSVAAIETYMNLVLKAGFGVGLGGKDPLILDLDGDGYELIRRDASGVYFDLDGDNFAEHSAWVKPDDGFLARDLNGNGKIDNITELFGTETTPGLTALATLDSNADGKISSADAGFASLRVWRDLNGNGVTDAGELQTLAEAGITQISLASSTPSTTNVRGNTIRAESTFTRADGTTSKIGDVLLETLEADSRYLGDTTVSVAAAALPELKGYGIVKDLRVAMTGDATLLSQVTALKNLPSSTNWTALKGAVDDVLFRWAGVDTVAATPFANGTFDEQKLAFLEKYTGESLVPRDAQGHPTAINASELIATWNDVLGRATIRIAAQGPWSTVFATASFDKVVDSFVSSQPTTLATIYSNALAQLSTNATTAAQQWTDNWAPALAVYAKTLVRADQNLVRNDYAVQSLVRALVTTPTVLSLAQLVAGLAMEGVQVGTAGADTLTRVATGPQLQIYVGGSGNDRLEGGAGQDVFVFGNNFGQDRIVDGEFAQSGDRVRLATLNASDVAITRSGDNLVITVLATGDTITVEGQYARPAFIPPWAVGSQPGYGIEDIQFADGTIYEAGQIALEIGKGTNGNDLLVGSHREDALRGLKGNDTVQGGDSGDIYYYWLGDGQDVFQDVRTDVYAAGTDAMFLLGGIMSDNVTLSRVAKSPDIKLTFSDGGSILLKDQAAYGPLGYGAYSLDSRIDSIFFTDGPAWSWLDLQQQVIRTYTTDGNDTTYGFGTPD